MTHRDTGSSTTATLPPLARAVLDAFTQGLVVFDPHGRLVYANSPARTALRDVGDLAGQRSDALRPRLLALGGRATPLKAGSAELGEAVFLNGDRPKTLAERERQAIVDTLDTTSGRLAEAARRLGISRTTLWRRLKAYGLDPTARP